jgi:hypothetical protein
MNITATQLKVLKALQQPGARMIPPKDRPGDRTGYVTNNGSNSGWICPVTLATKNILEERGLIKDVHGHFYLSDKGNNLLKDKPN